jgi:site-specific recombinase XerD
MKQIAVLCDQTPDTFPWHRLDRATVLALLEKLKQKGLADNTRNLYLSIIKGVTREAMLHQQMSDHQFSLIEQIRAVKLQRLAVGRALHVDEIAKLIDHCLHDEGAAGVRDAALLGILFGCGPRRAEVVTIDINKLNFSDRSIKVIGKGNKERELEMPPRTIDLVKTWLEESGLQFGPLFRPVNRWNQVAEDRRLTARGVYDIVTRRVKQAGLDKASPHDLRRSFLTFLLDNGEDLATAADMAGHASADTTRRYLRHQKRRNRAAADKIDF